MKIRAGLGLRNNRGELAQRLRHQTRLQSHLWIAHLAFEFGLGNQCSHRVDHHDIHAARTDQRLRNLQCLFAMVRLRNQQIVYIYTQLARVGGIERVFRVDERRLAAKLLRFGNYMQRQRRLTTRFRPINLDYAAARESAHAQRRVQRQASGRDHVHRHQYILVAQPHDRALAIRLFNLQYRRFQQFRFFVCHLTPRSRN